jgi:hypothetical protein
MYPNQTKTIHVPASLRLVMRQGKRYGNIELRTWAGAHVCLICSGT